MSEGGPILRPLPQRTFKITPASTATSTEPPSPSIEANDSSHPLSPSRTRSILNLTSSTLFGIYAPTENDGSREDINLNTPWGPGAQTPLMQSPQMDSFQAAFEDKRPPVIGAFERPMARRTPSHHTSTSIGSVIAILLRTILLFGFGMAYGVIVSHLHDSQGLAPVKVEGIDRSSWSYMGFWGVAGVAWGTLLPWVDVFWDGVLGAQQDNAPELRNGDISRSVNARKDETERPSSSAGSGSGMGADWNPVVRSIGAFIGIAFAIRKLPWQSTLQVSLTLALVNPVLWYLIDRSKPGFLLSATVGVLGTTILLGVNPDIVPSPATASPQASMLNVSSESVGSTGMISHETIGVWTWLASVLFCSCVCFGNIGRRLALGRSEQKKRD